MSDRVLTTIERIQENHRKNTKSYFDDQTGINYSPIPNVKKEMTLDGISQVIQSLVDKLDSLDRFVRDIRFAYSNKKESVYDAEYEWFKSNKEFIKLAVKMLKESKTVHIGKDNDTTT